MKEYGASKHHVLLKKTKDSKPGPISKTFVHVVIYY